MMWVNVKVMKTTASETDALGNPLAGEPEELWSGTGRFTPWSDLQIQMEDRDVTKNEQLLSIPVSYSTVEDADMVVADGITYQVTDKYNQTPRWTILQLKVYKS